MACDLIANMIEAGFSSVEMGGGCRALVRHVNGRTIVATAEDGDLPAEDSFLVCVYEGATLNPDARELDGFTMETVGDAPASGLSPIDEALQRADARANLVTPSDRIFSYLRGEGEKPTRADVLAAIDEEAAAARPCPDWLAEMRALL